MMLILFKVNGKVDFAFNPTNVLSVSYSYSSILKYWLATLTYTNGDSTEIRVSSEEVAQKLIENVVKSCNNLAHYIINLEDI